MKQEEILPAFSLTQMLGLFSAFFAPLSKFAIDAFGLVPTMRVLYGVTFVSMTLKFILVQKFSVETSVGRRRMEATRNKSVLRLLYECKDVYIKTVTSRRMLLTFGIVASYSLVTTLTNSYWSLLACRELGIAQGNVVVFTTIKSLMTLVCVLFLVPRVANLPVKRPMLGGLAMHIAAMALLLFAPRGVSAVLMLLLSTLLEAAALSILSPTTSSLMFINAGEEERARVCGLVYGTISLMTAVFPSLIGQMAEISLRLPFAVCIALFVFAGVLVVRLSRLPARGTDD